MERLEHAHRAFLTSRLSRLLYLLRWHAYSLWLFTFSDLKTIVFPSGAFALFHAVAFSSEMHVSLQAIFKRMPFVLFWAWINILPFAIDNQRQFTAIREDAANKPWRTLPSKRMSSIQAKRLMLGLYPFAILASIILGGLHQCLVLIALGFWYNDLGGADVGCVTRNLINAGGFICYTSGALDVMLAGMCPPVDLTNWFAMIGAIVFSTVHTQDMYDKKGDSLRDRKTVPLVIGDSAARMSIAVAMVFWCWACPAVWSAHFVSYTLSVGLGLAVTLRALLKRSVVNDKRTFRLWNLWLVSLYMLPMASEVTNQGAN